MAKLTALVQYPFLGAIVAKVPAPPAEDRKSFWLPSDDSLRTCGQVGRFSVHMRLVVGLPSRWSVTPEGFCHVAIDLIRMRITGHEDEPIPVPPEDAPRGTYRPRREYLDGRKGEYTGAALTAFRRAITFFRYELGFPAREDLVHDSRERVLFEWYDEDGNEIRDGTQVLGSARIPGRIAVWRYGASIFDPEIHCESLGDALANDPMPSSGEVLRADALDAAVGEDSRHATLSLAIACEVAIKERYEELLVGDDSHAGRALAWMWGDRIPRRADLLKGFAKTAFGESFIEYDKQAYDRINSLFEARNRAAHALEPTLPQQGGERREVSTDDLKDWWEASRILFEWLDELSPSG